MTAPHADRRRLAAIAAARVVSGAFALAVSIFCLLSYSPFAYGQFIKPSIVPELTDFINLSPWLFWLTLLITTLTQWPLRRLPRVGTYLIVWTIIGVEVALRPPLARIADSWRAVAVGLGALAPPIWLAILDQTIYPRPIVTRTDRTRLLGTCAAAAIVAWAVYAVAVPFRLHQVVGIDLTARAMAIGFGWSLASDAAVFMAVFTALAALVAIVRAVDAPPAAEYWSAIALLAVAGSVVFYALVCLSLSFGGAAAAIGSGAIGLTVAAVWSDVAWLRASGEPAIDAISLFSAAVVRSRAAAWAIVALLPLVALRASDAVAKVDWNFLMQKLLVAWIWLVVFAAAHALVRLSERRRLLAWQMVVAPAVVFAVAAVAARQPARAEEALDRYAVLDPSFRLIRDVQTTEVAETAEYYGYLRANTLLAPDRTAAADIDIDFVTPIAPAPRRPHIFLFIIDSLRRDYVSLYNPAVSFTPQIAKLGADSDVFERAFTRYAGTALAVPAIWAGGLVVHALEQPAFERRNAIGKLADANGYRRILSVDHVVADLFRLPPDVVRLDRGRTDVQLDLCRTIDELEQAIDAGDRRPVFFYALPQNVHVAVASRRKVPPGESYPGFFAPVASSLRRIDGCFGGFVDFLKRTGRYDDSIIVFTSDHGDSLGEEGRWGHAVFVVPEVMRVPLIVHVPAWLRARTPDRAALALSTDIAPTLYALLGYEPADLGPLFGRSLFEPPGTDRSWRRRESVLLASSYGAVYGMLHDNGRLMYVVDAVDGIDDAYDMTGLVGTRIAVTPSMTAANRAMIRAQLDTLAARYGYHRQP